MKNILIVALATTLALPAASFAKSNNDAHHGANGGQHGQMNGHHDGVMHQAAQELGLTEAQKTQMKALRKEFAPKRKAIREDKSLSPVQKRAQMKALNASFEARVNAILTPEQRTKLAAMIAQRRQQRRDHQHQGQHNSHMAAPQAH